MKKPECWFCGSDFRVEDWTLEDGSPAPMCRLHAATTRAGKKLPELGEHKTAELLDEAVGIDTRNDFRDLVPKKKKRGAKL